MPTCVSIHGHQHGWRRRVGDGGRALAALARGRGFVKPAPPDRDLPDPESPGGDLASSPRGGAFPDTATDLVAPGNERTSTFARPGPRTTHRHLHRGEQRLDDPDCGEPRPDDHSEPQRNGRGYRGGAGQPIPVDSIQWRPDERCLLSTERKRVRCARHQCPATGLDTRGGGPHSSVEARREGRPVY